MPKREELADGRKHGFEALERIDPKRISTFSDLTDQMAKTALAARHLGEGVEILKTMILDPGCKVVGTFSGPMTIAKQDLIIAEMIADGWFSAIVTTGAIIVHTIVQEIGKVHFKYHPSWDDARLYKAGYNRVYDSIELERSLDEAEMLLGKVLGRYESRDALCSSEICKMIGEELIAMGSERGILQEAVKKNVPIFIPAFTDSEIGLSFAIYNLRVGSSKKIPFDPFIDLDRYTEMACEADRLGIFTIGGGVPRNWAQQIGPYIDSMMRRKVLKGHRVVMFKYGVRICPEPVHWGGLSGCTYSEGVSWGKFVPVNEGGMYAEILCDATAVLPLIYLAVSEKIRVNG